MNGEWGRGDNLRLLAKLFTQRITNAHRTTSRLWKTRRIFWLFNVFCSLRGTNWLNQYLFSIFSRKGRGEGCGSSLALFKATACLLWLSCARKGTNFELSFKETWHSLNYWNKTPKTMVNRPVYEWSFGDVDENGPKVCRCIREDDGKRVDLLKRLVATGDLLLLLFSRRCWCCSRDGGVWVPPVTTPRPQTNDSANSQLPRTDLEITELVNEWTIFN